MPVGSKGFDACCVPRWPLLLLKALCVLCMCGRTLGPQELGGSRFMEPLEPPVSTQLQKSFKSVGCFWQSYSESKKAEVLGTPGSCGVLAAGMSNQDDVERYNCLFSFLLTRRCGRGCRHCSRLLAAGMSNQEVVEYLAQGKRHRQPIACPDSLYQLMLECWRKVPEQRPTFEHLYQTLDDFAVNVEAGYKDPATLA